MNTLLTAATLANAQSSQPVGSKPSTSEESSSLIACVLHWKGTYNLTPGRSAVIHCNGVSLDASVIRVKYGLDTTIQSKIPKTKVGADEIAVLTLMLSGDMLFHPFISREEKYTFFTIEDVATKTTVGTGIVLHGMRRSQNVIWQHTDLCRDIRAAQKAQKPLTFWLTGLSGAGKSTMANALEKELYSRGKHTMLLDGDNIRHGLNKNLGFAEVDRIENIRRVAETAKLMNDAGLIVITSTISPYNYDRAQARKIIGPPFIEVYISTPLDVCEQRDAKGLYKKAREGHIPNFTGISAPYEPPEHPELVVDTSVNTLASAMKTLMQSVNRFL